MPNDFVVTVFLQSKPHLTRSPDAFGRAQQLAALLI